MKRFWTVRWLDKFSASHAENHSERMSAIMQLHQLRDLQERGEVQDPRLWECTEIQC